ncbi:MAG: hypothetical protein ACJ73S_06110 [Mycobacteriales bacterium]
MTPGADKPQPQHPLSDQVDIEALLADEHLIQSLAAGAAPAGYDDDPLTAMLCSWRDEARAGAEDVAPTSATHPTTAASPAATTIPAEADSPRAQRGDRDPDTLIMPAVVDLDDAELAGEDGDDDGAIPLAGRTRRGHHRQQARRLRYAAVAAIVVGAFSLGGGMAAATVNAKPGSPLWPLAKVIDSDHAHSVEARMEVQEALRQAQKDAREGDTAQALERLRKAKEKLAQVKPDDGKDELSKQLGQLEKQVGAVTPVPGPTPTSTGGPAPTPTPSAKPSPSDKPSDKPSPTPPASPPATSSPSDQPSGAAAPNGSSGTGGTGTTANSTDASGQSTNPT